MSIEEFSMFLANDIVLFALSFHFFFSYILVLYASIYVTMIFQFSSNLTLWNAFLVSKYKCFCLNCALHGDSEFLAFGHSNVYLNPCCAPQYSNIRNSYSYKMKMVKYLQNTCTITLHIKYLQNFFVTMTHAKHKIQCVTIL